MGKLKRKKLEPKRSMLIKGRMRYRRAEDVAAARKQLDAYLVEEFQLDSVKLMACNGIPKKDICKLLDIDIATFEKHFGRAYEIGKTEKNLKVTSTLYNAAVGHEGVWDEKKKRWVTRPRGPDITAIIWWDKTRGGMNETQNLKHSGRVGGPPGAVTMNNTVIYMPPNGREAGAKGDPTYVIREQQRVLEQQAREAAE